MLGNERNVLLFLCVGDLRCVWCARAISASVGSYALSLQVLLVLDGSFGIVEHLGEEVPLGLLDGLRFLEFIQRLLSILMRGCLLSTLFSFCGVQCIVDLPVDLFSLHIHKLAIDIAAQVVVLNAFPLVAISLASIESAANLFRRELTVLTHRVDTNDILNLMSCEGLRFDLGPVALVSHILSLRIVSKNLLFAVLLFLLVLALQLFLLRQLFFNIDCVSHAIVVRLNHKARVILQTNCEVGAELWHLEEVDARLTDYFLHEHMGQVFLLDFFALFINLVSEDVKGEAAALGEDLVDEELVLSVGVGEMDLLLAAILNVCLVIVSVSDGFLRRDKLANVDSGSVAVSLQVVRQLLHVV